MTFMYIYIFLAQLYVELHCCPWMDGSIMNVERKSLLRDSIKKAKLCEERGLMLLFDVHIVNIQLNAQCKKNIPSLSNTKPHRWIIQLHATRCCHSPRMRFSVASMIVSGPHSFTGKGPIENKIIKDRPRRFVNSSSRLKCFPLLLNRNAFDLKLEAAVFSDDNEYYMETALRCNSASCPPQWCSVCQQEPRPEAGLAEKKKTRRLSADFHGISTAKSLTSLCDSCCQLIEFCNSSFILVYCQHNRWQADETPLKN